MASELLAVRISPELMAFLKKEFKQGDYMGFPEFIREILRNYRKKQAFLQNQQALTPVELTPSEVEEPNFFSQLSTAGLP